MSGENRNNTRISSLSRKVAKWFRFENWGLNIAIFGFKIRDFSAPHPFIFTHFADLTMTKHYMFNCACQNYIIEKLKCSRYKSLSWFIVNSKNIRKLSQSPWRTLDFPENTVFFVGKHSLFSVNLKLATFSPTMAFENHAFQSQQFLNQRIVAIEHLLTARAGNNRFGFAILANVMLFYTLKPTWFTSFDSSGANSAYQMVV